MLKCDLILAVRKKRPGLVGKFYLHHENAIPYTSANTKATLTELDIKTIPLLGYSPDLVSCDFWLFHTIRKELRESHFDDVEDLQVVGQECIRRIPTKKLQKLPRILGSQTQEVCEILWGIV